MKHTDQDSRVGGGLSGLLVATRSLRRRPLPGLAVALALFGVAFVARLALGRLGMKAPLPFATFAPVVLIAPLVGGLRAGLAVAFLSAAFAWYFFMPAASPDGSNAVVLATYFVTSLAAVGVVHILDVEFERLIRERERSDQLFQELQHRVANNLQIVSTILRLQEPEIVDADSGRAALRDAGGRLATIGALHRRLYDPQIEQVDVADHIDGLCRDIFRSAGAENVTWRVEGPTDVRLPPARTLALSLIVNEVVVNALKYAFPNGRNGRVTVRLEEDASDYALTVADDGVGLAPDTPGNGGLGTRIVSSLAAQLGGTPEWSSGPGATFMLRFPK